MEGPFQPGEVLLGKYQVERILGRGGMGVVIAARHLTLGELFAIKLLRPEALAERDAVERFVREARAAARLKGDHVARVHDVGQLDGGVPYMLMEHLDGSDLGALVRSRGALPLEEAVNYVLQACEAIAEAHALGIVHRDLKPANLFLARRPKGAPCVKVLDFGISKQISAPEGHLTKTGAFVGTPFYMSPEQMTRTREVDARSDVWALGVVLHELTTGTLPFHGDDPVMAIAQVLHEDPPPPSQVRPGLPARLDAVVQRCLQKRRALRFQSIEELAAALRELLDAEAGAGTASSSCGAATAPEEPAPSTGSMRTTTPMRLGATGAAWGQTQREGRAARRKGARAALLGATLGLGLLGVGGMWWALRREPSANAAAAPAPAEKAPPGESIAPAESATTAAAPVEAPAATREAPPAPAEVPPPEVAAAPVGAAGKPVAKPLGKGEDSDTGAQGKSGAAQPPATPPAATPPAATPQKKAEPLAAPSVPPPPPPRRPPTIY